jgi:signal transduction histidine kinase
MLTYSGEIAAPALINRDLIAQALLNLIENAIRHAGEGNSRIEVQLSQTPNQSAEISVKDNGQGIPANMLDAVTERFVRLDPSRSTPGTGLGLNLVKAIAEAHGGTFALSDNHPGLKATISLPLVK